MDRAEIARRVERAEKLLQKGKTGEALDEYMQVLAEDPQNDNVRQMAADICLSLQRTAEAVKLLGELFERQIAAGENTRASLTYKKLARYTVPTSIQRVQFGQILETSNRKLALETYESALEDLSKNGRQQDCLMVLKRLVALEPAERNFLRLGELCSQTGDKAGAAAAFLKLAEMTEASGANAAQWFERAYTEDSTDSEDCSGLWQEPDRARPGRGRDICAGTAGQGEGRKPGNPRDLCEGAAVRQSPERCGAAGLATVSRQIRPASKKWQT